MNIRKMVIPVYLFFFATIILNCTGPSSFRVQVSDDDTEEPIEGVKVQISSREAGRIPLRNTNSMGYVEFNEVKSTPFRLSMTDPDKRYKKLDDSLITKVNFSDTLNISLEKLVTTVRGKVLDDSTYNSLDSCLIRIAPSGLSNYTNEKGVFSFRTSQILKNTSYNITAEHTNYLRGERQSLKFDVNEVNDIGAFMLERKNKVDIGEEEVVPPYPKTSDGKVRTQ